MTAPITLAPIKREKPKKKQHNVSDEERQARSERMRRLRQDPVWREKHRKATSLANKKRWADPENKAALVAKFRGNEMKRLARLRTALNEKYSDPAEREKLSQRMISMQKEGRLDPKKSATKHTKAGRARCLAAAKRGQDKKRGFAIPKHLRDEYRFLVYSKNLSPIEAGIVLGIIGKPARKAA
jgi:hypothetical protein